jgi:hypothetical protein
MRRRRYSLPIITAILGVITGILTHISVTTIMEDTIVHTIGLTTVRITEVIIGGTIIQGATGRSLV